MACRICKKETLWPYDICPECKKMIDLPMQSFIADIAFDFSISMKDANEAVMHRLEQVDFDYSGSVKEEKSQTDFFKETIESEVSMLKYYGVHGLSISENGASVFFDSIEKMDKIVPHTHSLSGPNGVSAWSEHNGIGYSATDFKEEQ